MSKILTTTRLRLLAGLLGVLLLAHLIRQAGLARFLESVASRRWELILIMIVGGIAHLVKAWAWRLTLPDEQQRVSFGRMLGLRLASEAVGQLGVLGLAFGETMRVSLLGSTVPLAKGIASVSLDRALFVLSGSVVTVIGLISALVVLPHHRKLWLYAGLAAFMLLGLVSVTALAVRRRWAVLSRTALLAGRIRYFSGWLERKRSLLHLVENHVLDFCHQNPGAFFASFALNVLCHALAVLEVYLILLLLGARSSFVTALAIEALTKLVNVLGALNPGNIGTYEGGNMLIGRMFGLSGAAGLTLALTRRLRAIFWAAVGSVCLVMLSKSRKASLESPGTVAPSGRSQVAVILANSPNVDRALGSLLPKVGALPILLRAILGAQKVGATRIIVVLNRLTGLWVKRELLLTRRIPGSVEWVQLGLVEESLKPLLGQLIGQGKEHLVLIAGDRTHHPSLLKRAVEWSGAGDLALTTGSQLVGICSVCRESTNELATRGPSRMACLEDVYHWLAATRSLETQAVPQDKWQRILTRQDRVSAEEKLDRWIVKPTDGIFARLNRRVSIPISRRLIQYPITPNMVSLFTLGVSFLSGVFLAAGGYRYMLLGALLSLFASILDGCDGEVARLKLQESAFGAWLETVCDYLYYLFIFVGMTIGLLRGSGSSTYLVWGGLLLFGAVASFLASGLQRHRLTNGHPEQLLGIWQAQAEKRRSNPLLFIGRHTEFLIRRCFLPYALLFFALINVTSVAFILCAIGANAAWIIVLYSNRAFVSVQESTSEVRWSEAI